MSKPLVFTMPTFPYLLELSNVYPRVLKLGPELKNEIEYLKKVVQKEEPELIIGFSASKSNKSYIEKNCFNEIHKKKILIDGPDFMELYVPKRLPKNITPRVPAARSFCNYVCYLLAMFIYEEDLKTKLSFYHVSQKTVSDLDASKVV